MTENFRDPILKEVSREVQRQQGKGGGKGEKEETEVSGTYSYENIKHNLAPAHIHIKPYAKSPSTWVFSA